MLKQKEDKKTTLLDDERGLIVSRAACEIDVLLDIVIEKANSKSSFSDEDMKDIARGLAIRVKQLNSVVISAINDHGESNEELLLRANY